MSYADKTLTCRECGAEFTFTSGEQEFFATHGLTNEPGRCPECRASRRAAQRAADDGYGPVRREMFTATCSNCGKDARVPFEPRADRPVYCSECFEQIRGARTPR